MIRKLALALTLVLHAHFYVQNTQAADLVRFVRLKISAGDLATGLAMAVDYKKATGVDEEYLNAIAWIARGAESRRRNRTQAIAELRKEIPAKRGDAQAWQRSSKWKAVIERRKAAERRPHFEINSRWRRTPSCVADREENINLLS